MDVHAAPFLAARFCARSSLALTRLTARSSSSCEHNPNVTGSTALILAAFQCERSRIFAMVALVVQTSLMISLSENSGWLRISQYTASGLSWRLLTGV